MARSTTRVKSDAAGTTLILRHAEQYAGVWAMERQRFDRMMHMVRTMDLGQHVRVEGPRAAAARAERPVSTRVQPTNGASGTVHVIEMRGTLTKYGSSMSDAPPMISVQREIRALIKAGTTAGIVMVIDSPGGTVAGTKAVWEALRAASAAGIRTVAYVEDIAASGGYFIASGCDHIMAGSGAEVGSIGAMLVIEDVSKMYEAAGVRPEVFTSTPLKGVGVPGTSLSDEQRAEVQRYIGECGRMFTEAVAAGRGVSIDTAAAWSDARMHRADIAKGMGLLDTIGTLDDAITMCADPAALKEIRTMATNATKTEQTTDQAAALPGLASPAAAQTAKAEEAAPYEKPEEGQTTKKAKAEGDEEDDDKKTMEKAKAEDEDKNTKPGTPTEPEQTNRPATAAELRGLGAGSDFALASLEAGLTLAQATVMAQQHTTGANAAEKVAAQPAAPRAGTPVGGVPAGKGMSGAAGKHPGEDYDQSADVRAACAAVGMTRQTFVSWADSCVKSGDDYIAELRDWARAGID